MAVPKPVNVNVVCSECGLPWDSHEENARGKVTLDECVRLLKLEVSKPRPVVLPFPTVKPRPVYPWYGGGPTTGGGYGGGTTWGAGYKLSVSGQGH